MNNFPQDYEFILKTIKNMGIEQSFMNKELAHRTGMMKNGKLDSSSTPPI